MRTYLILALFLFGCNPNSKVIKTPKEFFDLTQFIEAYVSDSTTLQVTKKIVVDGTAETRKLNDYPIYEDVQAFASYDINRPALFDKYGVDSELNGDTAATSYRAVDPELKVQLLKVKTKGNSVISLEIKTQSHSFLEDVSLDIYFAPDHGYQLNRQSHRIFKAPKNQLVEVVFSQ